MSQSTGIGDDGVRSWRAVVCPVLPLPPASRSQALPGVGHVAWGGPRSHFRTHRGHVQRRHVLQQCQRHSRQTVPPRRQLHPTVTETPELLWVCLLRLAGQPLTGFVNS